MGSGTMGVGIWHISVFGVVLGVMHMGC